MGESERAIIKPEDMKSFIWVETAGGSIQQVEEEVALYCPLICKERHHAGMGSSKNYPISLPQRVSQASLNAILDYCRFHQVLGRSNKERKSFDEKFVKKDTQRLCELTSAADALQLRPLVDLTSRSLARKIEGKSPEEIREILHLPDDLTEEEKLEPIKNIYDDPRIRLLNLLNAKKRKELKEKKMLKNAEAEESTIVGGDERSVDDLISFINGGDRDHKHTKIKKKSKRRKGPPKDNSSDGLKNTHGKEVTNGFLACNGNGDASSTNSSRSSILQDFAQIEFNDDDDDDDDDDYSDLDLDPGEKEKLDREIEEFKIKLNDDWLSKGQQPKLVPNISNGSVLKYAGLKRN